MKQRLTALILLCALLTGCAAAGKGEQPLTATVLAMDTVMNFTLYGGGMGEEQLRQALSGAEDTLRQLDAARTAKRFVTAGIRHRLSSRLPFDSLWQGGLAAEV